MDKVIGFRRDSISRLVMAAICDMRRKPDTVEGKVCRPSAGQVDVLAALDGKEESDDTAAEEGDDTNAEARDCSLTPPRNNPDAAEETMETKYPLYEAKNFHNVRKCMMELGARGLRELSRTWTDSEDARIDGDHEGPRDECDSNYPLYEAYRAGLENAVTCMLERSAGFREEAIEEAERLVAEARRRHRWDATENLLLLVTLLPIISLACHVMFVAGGGFRGPEVVCILVVAGSYYFFYPSLKIWILDIQPSDGFLRYEAWYVSKYAAIFFVFTLPFISLLILSNSPNYKYVQGEYTIDLASGSTYYQFTVWSYLSVHTLAWLVIYYGIQHLIVRRVSMIGCVQRWAPDLLKFHPLLFAVNFLASSYNPFSGALILALIFGSEFVVGTFHWFVPNSASAQHDSFSHQLEDIDKGLRKSRPIIFL